jgi:hypothetical protein
MLKTTPTCPSHSARNRVFKAEAMCSRFRDRQIFIDYTDVLPSPALVNDRQGILAPLAFPDRAAGLIRRWLSP